MFETCFSFFEWSVCYLNVIWLSSSRKEMFNKLVYREFQNIKCLSQNIKRCCPQFVERSCRPRQRQRKRQRRADIVTNSSSAVMWRVRWWLGVVWKRRRRNEVEKWAQHGRRHESVWGASKRVLEATTTVFRGWRGGRRDIDPDIETGTNGMVRSPQFSDFMRVENENVSVRKNCIEQNGVKIRHASTSFANFVSHEDLSLKWQKTESVKTHL